MYTDPHRPQGERPILVSLTPLPAETWFSKEVSQPGTNHTQPCSASVGWVTWVVKCLKMFFLYTCGYTGTYYNSAF